MINFTRLYRSLNDLHAALPRALNSGYAFPPMRVGCVLTHRCNLKCSMCFVWKHGGADFRDRELTTLEWINIFKQVPRYGIITFTGGEPLVRRDLPELLLAATKHHRVHLVSNGTLFNDDFVRLCVDSAPKNLFDKGLLSIGVSLEGPEAVHDTMVNVPGAFRRTTETLRSLV